MATKPSIPLACELQIPIDFNKRLNLVRDQGVGVHQPNRTAVWLFPRAGSTRRCPSSSIKGSRWHSQPPTTSENVCSRRERNSASGLPPLIAAIEAAKLRTNICDRFALACGTWRKSTISAESSFLRLVRFQFEPFEETIVCGTAFYPIQGLRCSVALIIKFALREGGYLMQILRKPFGVVRKMHKTVLDCAGDRVHW
jgi:hypothetical protein